jgi:hypothetical protein
MDDQELRELLERLHGEIDQTTSLDDNEKALLRDLRADIGDLLERSESDRLLPHPTIVQRLESTIDQVEATHPALNTLLTKLLEILSNAGI